MLSLGPHEMAAERLSAVFLCEPPDKAERCPFVPDDGRAHHHCKNSEAREIYDAAGEATADRLQEGHHHSP